MSTSGEDVDENESQSSRSSQAPERVLLPDEQNKVDELLRTFNDEPRFVAWMKKTKHGRTQSRIIIIGSYRVITVKKGFKGKKVRRNGHMLDLTRIDSGAPDHVKLTFRSDPTDPLFFFLDIQSDKCMEIVKHCIDATRPITVGFPESHLIVNVPTENLLPPDPFTPSPGDGYVDTYKAMCSYYKEKESLGLVQYCKDAFDQNSTVMNLSEVPGIETGTNFTFSLIPVFAALRYNHYFNEICLSGINRREVVSCLAECLRYNTSISRISITNAGAASESFIGLGKSLATNQGTKLAHIDFSGNPMRNNGVSGLSQGLAKLPNGLMTLKLDGCGFSGQGINDLTNAFEANSAIPETMVDLSLSYNNIGIDGSDRLSEWLGSLRFLETIALRRLHLANTKIQLLNLCGAIRSSCSELEFLDIAYNKIDKKGAETLAVLLSSTTALSEINLSNCQLINASVHLILHSMCHNQKLKNVRINLASNNISNKGAEHVARGITGGENLHTLILSDNGLMTDGITQILDALQKVPIRCLAIDRNVKKKAFQLSQALASFINTTPSLEELRMAGNKKLFTGSAIKPLFQAMKHNTTLKTLDVTGNFIEDEVVNVLIESLRENQSLTRLYWDDNKVSLSGYQAFKSMIQVNQAISQMDFPTLDIQVYIQMSKDAQMAKNRMKEVLDAIDQCLKRNGRDRNFVDAGFLVGRSSDDFYASDPNADITLSSAGSRDSFRSDNSARPIKDLRRQVSYAAFSGNPNAMAPPQQDLNVQYDTQAPAPPPAPAPPAAPAAPPVPNLAPAMPMAAAEPVFTPMPDFYQPPVEQPIPEAPQPPAPPAAGFDPSMLASAIQGTLDGEVVEVAEPEIPDFDPDALAKSLSEVQMGSEEDDERIPPLPEF